MSQDIDTSNEDQGPDELTLLKDRARHMGISHSPNIGLEALRKKIADKLSGETDAAPAAAADAEEPEAVELNPAQRRRQIRRDALALVRVRITNMNPSKADLPGEIFTVANKYLGIVKKFIPYGEATDNGYHIPKVLYDQLKDRKFLQVKTKPNPRNPAQIEVERRWVPEFGIEILPALTEEDLKRLANQQAAAAGMAA